MKGQFEIFLAALPGLEPVVEAEARERGFAVRGPVPGGVALTGGWRDVIRANLELRCTSRVLARITSFTAMALGQLEARTAEVDWRYLLDPDVPVRVEASVSGSKIARKDGAADRVVRAIRTAASVPIGPGGVTIRVRIEKDRATLSVDTSGEPLHRRGHKEAVGKAPMRETMAAAFLRQMGFNGSEPVLDPMCGSGTFVIEAAEMARGLQPGRSRDFAFEKLAIFDPMDLAAARKDDTAEATLRFLGADRDAGAVASALANATRSGVADMCDFACLTVSDIARPVGPPGLVIVNPPYGARIGEVKPLFGLYSTFGRVMKERFSGWRVGLITTEPALAKTTGLPIRPAGPPVPHGPLRVTLWQTDVLP